MIKIRKVLRNLVSKIKKRKKRILRIGTSRKQVTSLMQ